MKRLALAGAVFAVSALFAPSVFAYSSPGLPSGYVNDFAGVLSTGAKQSLESELASFEQSTSNEITVVTVPNMGGDYIENYAVKLFEEWGIGKKDTDNGVLLLLAIEERKMRIETGYGLEGALPDSIAQSILNNEMTPRLKAGDYDGAVAAGAKAIEQATRGEYVGSNNESSFGKWNIEFFFVFGVLILQFLIAILARTRSCWVGGVVGFIGGLGLSWFLVLSLWFALPLTILLAALGTLFDYVVSKGYQKAKASGVTPPWWTGGMGGGGHSGGGFGGFSGGSSGGGGSSGSW